jgi:hypothetical protein
MPHWEHFGTANILATILRIRDRKFFETDICHRGQVTYCRTLKYEFPYPKFRKARSPLGVQGCVPGRILFFGTVGGESNSE